MAEASLPEDGTLRLGSVTLPAGKQFHGGIGTDEPVAWVTREPVPDAGNVWAALYDTRQDTGLLPFLLGYLDGEPDRPWDTEEFLGLSVDPAELGRTLDHMHADVVLESLWDGQTQDEDPESVAYLEAETAPFSRQFPGLAPPGETPLTDSELGNIVRSLPAQRIGLASATRPAEVLPLIGWTPSGAPLQTIEVAAVVRSWEDRFGARLLKVGFAEFSLLVTRPPRTMEHAQQIAAEHWAFCAEFGGEEGLRDIPSISDYLLKSPIWTFWWD